MQLIFKLIEFHHKACNFIFSLIETSYHQPHTTSAILQECSCFANHHARHVDAALTVDHRSTGSARSNRLRKCRYCSRSRNSHEKLYSLNCYFNPTKSRTVCLSPLNAPLLRQASVMACLTRKQCLQNLGSGVSFSFGPLEGSIIISFSIFEKTLLVYFALF